MPQQAPGTLTRPQATDLTAYILQFNKYPAGPDLTDATAAQFTLPAGKAAPAASPTPVAGAQGIPLNVATNLAEFMRGLTFPNANVIFNAQLRSPAEDKPKMPIPYDYVLWGRTVYYGWQAVDEAIAALKETTPLMLLPGRRCQNGRPVPLQNADFQKYVHELIAFTDQLKDVAAKRDADKLSEMADALNNTCANCHKVYRDVTPTGALQSSSTQGGEHKKTRSASSASGFFLCTRTSNPRIRIPNLLRSGVDAIRPPGRLPGCRWGLAATRGRRDGVIGLIQIQILIANPAAVLVEPAERLLEDGRRWKSLRHGGLGDDQPVPVHVGRRERA